ncbi:MFS transporter [Xanthomonas campestris]|uniref:MFS transporter n=1 Tax=Xanthomonas campestris TaxID=339 RepID=UPI003CE4FDD9
MVWYLLGPLQVPIAQALGLDTQQRALMVAVPILCGAVLRLVLGMLADRIGAKRAGVVAQLAVIASLFGAWQLGVHSMGQVLLLGVLLGIAGASFAVALPLASRWYPPEHQGTAMGIAGAGNSGTVLAALFAPMLALAFGYQNVFGLACIPLVLTLLVFVLIAREAPIPVARKRWADYGRVLVGNRDAWRFMFFYSVTFGGFSGFASALPGYFHDQFGFDARTAGWATAACVLAGRLGDAPARRCHRRPRWRHARLAGGVLAGRHIGGHRRLRRRWRNDHLGAVRAHAAVPGCRQWRGVPAGAAALRPGHRGDDRPDRHGRRHWRLCIGRGAGRAQAAHRQLCHRHVVVRGVRPGWLGAAGRRQDPMAQ